ncbi:MAG: bifunctional oligoribonuclease/PAP phosphatase NrnA [Flavobacteriaceae bacterium]|nr:bifunctional oligoribonuclease/PAP phosphatase NrnA [Flavobacteriaceae bacterium]
MIKNQLEQLKQWLDKPATVVIIPHKNPDGDAMGSCLAWQGMLNQLGHSTSVIAPNDYPTFLHWLPGHDGVLIYENDQELADKLIAGADMVFTLDFNTLKRIDQMGARVAESAAKKVMIDHHQEPDDYADITFSNPAIGSTCEFVFQIIDAMGLAKHINQDIASCLYTGIVTDTGSFRFSSVTSATHRAVATLIDAGANHSEIHEKIKDNARPDRLKLLGIALKNMVFISEYKTAYITISQDELDACNYQKGDTEGFVNYGLSVAGIEMAVLMTESKKEEMIKISFRSKGDLAVNLFAKTYFEGGGHINAAGGKSDKSLRETEAYFLKSLAAFLS